jgi:hypothetical protein
MALSGLRISWQVVEVGRVVQARQVGDDNKLLAERHHAFTPQSLQHPVDVDRGKSKRVGKLLLRERAEERAVGGKSDPHQALVQFRQKVSDALPGGAAAEADQTR